MVKHGKENHSKVKNIKKWSGNYKSRTKKKRRKRKRRSSLKKEWLRRIVIKIKIVIGIRIGYRY